VASQGVGESHTLNVEHRPPSETEEFRKLTVETTRVEATIPTTSRIGIPNVEMVHQ